MAAAVGIVGRYDWSAPHRRFAERGALLSGYLCLLGLPVVFGLLRRALPRRPRAAVAGTAVGFVALTLPYRWLRLDRWFYYRSRVLDWYNPPTDVPFPRPQFLPGGPWGTFPHAVAGTLVALALTAVVVLVLCRRRARSGRRRGRSIAAVGAVIGLVVVQSFLHSGVRSPYAYMTHYQGPPRPDLWYAVAHFDDGSGVTNADQFVFSAIEQYFHGVAVDPNNMLVRRPMAFYVASQLSYFVNTFYVWTVLNATIWVAAVLAGFGFARRLVGRSAARYFAAMIAVGPGFVAFAGTPAMYVAGFAVVIFALYLGEWLLVDHAAQLPASNVALYGAALACCALTYDLGVVFPALFAYFVARRVPARQVLLALVGAYGLYRGFLFVHNVVLDIPVVDTNAAQLTHARDHVLDVASQPSAWFGAVRDAAGAYAVMVARMFFYVPVVLALPGLIWLRDRAQQVLVGGLTLVTFATVAFLRIGQQLIGWMPRFTYPVYPAVYLLAALTLERSVAAWRRRALPGGAFIARVPWAVLVILAMLANVDSFGHVRLYYEALEGTHVGRYLGVDPVSGAVRAAAQ